jgi:hypothetical protein
MAAAVIDPMKYEELNREVRVSRSFGWPSSPIKDEPEIIQNTIPNPSTIRAKRYIPTKKISYMALSNGQKTYDLGQTLE